MQARKRGLYVSYNEQENGPFSEAVTISNTLGCVTWFDTFALNPTNLNYPTDIAVRITGEEKYYRGVLLAVARKGRFGEGFAEGERNHCPVAWQQRDRERKVVMSLLFINGLHEVEKPREVEGRHPPQHPTYIELEDEA